MYLADRDDSGLVAALPDTNVPAMHRKVCYTYLEGNGSIAPMLSRARSGRFRLEVHPTLPALSLPHAWSLPLEPDLAQLARLRSDDLPAKACL